MKHPHNIGLVAFVALVLMLTIYRCGLSRGMDHAMTFGPESEQNAIAIALSDIKCGLNAGYVGHSTIKQELVDRQSPSGPNDPAIVPGLRDRAKINTAIAAAAAVPCPRLDQAHIDTHTLMTMLYDDVGVVDYVKMSFRLFGANVEGLYFTFFLLLVLSVVMFLIEFRDAPTPNLILLSTLAAFLAEINSSIFTDFMPSVWGLRHSSTLAIIPAWHLALLMLYRRPMTKASSSLAAVQIALIMFAIAMRGSARWVLIALVALALALALREHWARRMIDRPWLTGVGRSLVRWPLVALLAGAVLWGAWMSSRLHIVYGTDDIMPTHGLWDAAYQGFAMSPAAARMGVGNASNSSAYRGGVAWAREHNFLANEESWVSPWTHTYKMRMYDNILRATVIDIWKRFPIDSLLLYAVYKPARLVSLYFGTLLDLPMWVLAFAGLATFGLALIVDDTPKIELSFAAIAIGVASAAPNIWAYPEPHTIADFVVIATASGLMALAYGIQRWWVRGAKMTHHIDGVETVPGPVLVRGQLPARRSWRERLFSWPWRPLKAENTVNGIYRVSRSWTLPTAAEVDASRVSVVLGSTQTIIAPIGGYLRLDGGDLVERCEIPTAARWTAMRIVEEYVELVELAVADDVTKPAPVRQRDVYLITTENTKAAPSPEG